MEAAIVPPNWMINNKLYMITGLDERDLTYISAFLNSKLFSKIILQSVNFGGGKGVDFLGNIRLPRLQCANTFFDDLSFAQLYGLSQDEIQFIESQ